VWWVRFCVFPLWLESVHLADLVSEALVQQEIILKPRVFQCAQLSQLCNNKLVISDGNIGHCQSSKVSTEGARHRQQHASSLHQCLLPQLRSLWWFQLRSLCKESCHLEQQVSRGLVWSILKAFRWYVLHMRFTQALKAAGGTSLQSTRVDLQ
jgi:hypothetical protein